MSEQILVAGGAGFVGSRIALHLAECGYRVIALDNLRRRGSELNLPALGESGIRFIHGDVRCCEDLETTDIESETIIDCAAEPSVLASSNWPAYSIQSNLAGSINLMELARKWQSRFLFLSTSRVYPIPLLQSLQLEETATRFELSVPSVTQGVSENGISESAPLTGHRTIYGTTKLAVEQLVEEYHAAFSIPTLINRCGVIAGPGQLARSDQGVFALWVAAHVLRQPLRYIGFGGRGLQVRDLIHIDDLVELIEIQLQNFDALSGETFNVGGGLDRSLSLQEATSICRDITGNQIELLPEPRNRIGDIPWFVTDARRIQQRLNWNPERTAERTLEDIAAWITDGRQELEPILELKNSS